MVASNYKEMSPEEKDEYEKKVGANKFRLFGDVVESMSDAPRGIIVIGTFHILDSSRLSVAVPDDENPFLIPVADSEFYTEFNWATLKLRPLTQDGVPTELKDFEGKYGLYVLNGEPAETKGDVKYLIKSDDKDHRDAVFVHSFDRWFLVEGTTASRKELAVEDTRDKKPFAILMVNANGSAIMPCNSKDSIVIQSAKGNVFKTIPENESAESDLQELQLF